MNIKIGANIILNFNKQKKRPKKVAFFISIFKLRLNQAPTGRP